LRFLTVVGPVSGLGPTAIQTAARLPTASNQPLRCSGAIGHVGRAACAWAEAKLETGTVPTAPGDCPTHAPWADGFFGAGGRGDLAKKARGRTLSETCLCSCGRTVEAHVLPLFGRKRLSDISPLELETFLLDLYGSGRYAGATVNNLLKAVRMLFAEAERLGVVRENPAKRVGRFADNGLERGAPSQDEREKLLAVDALTTVWWGLRMPYLVAMVAAGCGLRHGKPVALTAPLEPSEGE